MDGNITVHRLNLDFQSYRYAIIAARKHFLKLEKSMVLDIRIGHNDATSALYSALVEARLTLIIRHRLIE